jgi:hypothetical protein
MGWDELARLVVVRGALGTNAEVVPAARAMVASMQLVVVLMT